MERKLIYDLIRIDIEIKPFHSTNQKYYHFSNKTQTAEDFNCKLAVKNTKRI